MLWQKRPVHETRGRKKREPHSFGELFLRQANAFIRRSSMYLQPRPRAAELVVTIAALPTAALTARGAEAISCNAIERCMVARNEDLEIVDA